MLPAQCNARQAGRPAGARGKGNAMKLGMLHLFENPLGKTEHQIIKEQMELMY